jgi:hypothetical protein
MNTFRVAFRSRWSAVVVVAAVVGSLSSILAAQDGDGKKKADAPGSVDVQVFVIMASQGDTPQADASLKELAELLTANYGTRFNQFSLHRTTSVKIRLDQEQTCGLAADYFLKAKYVGADMSDEAAPKMDLALRIVRITAEAEGKPAKEVGVLGPVGAKVVKGKFILLGGPKVDEKTMILAVRVTGSN